MLDIYSQAILDEGNKTRSKRKLDKARTIETSTRHKRDNSETRPTRAIQTRYTIETTHTRYQGRGSIVGAL